MSPLLERWNTHFSTTVDQELFGIEFQLHQDPNSSNLGTTVWDASIVLAKYIEKNSRRGDFSRPKVRGKQVLELGAGMGLAGMALAILGADVAFTDIGDVLPLLQRNVDQNISPAALKVKDAAWAAAEVGKATVASLDWSDPACYANFRPPYDFILAADCVYSELAVPHLLATVLHMCGPRTQTIITNEFRSQAVHDEFMQQFGQYFTIRKVPANKLDPNFHHPLIHIYLLKRRKEPLAAPAAEAAVAAPAAEAASAAAGASHAAGGAADDKGQQSAGQSDAEGQSGDAAVGQAGEPQAAQVQEAGSMRDAARPACLQAAAADPREAAAAAVPAADEEEEERPSASSDAQQSAAAGMPDARSGRYERQFQTRREGAMLARALKDVKL